MKHKLFAWMLAISFAFTNLNSFVFAEEVQEEETEDTSEEKTAEESATESDEIEENSTETLTEEETPEESENSEEITAEVEGSEPVYDYEISGNFKYVLDEEYNDEQELVWSGVRILSYFGNESDVVVPSMIGGITVYCIDRQAFSGLTYLKNVRIPEGITKINYGAFSGCTGLTSITIPEGVTEIGSRAFESCTGLTSITIPEGVTEIGSSAFKSCTGLTSITIPEGVTEIGPRAFDSCTGLTSITIPEGVTYIESGTFDSCTGLTSITIPEGVTEIESYAFESCTGLTSITIPEGVTEIGIYAFESCTGLTSITIPDSVTEIGYGAFRECIGLANITIPEGVKSIGQNTFAGSGLTSIIIPESARVIDRDAFSNCTSLTSITIYDGVETIGWDAFLNCENITELHIESIEGWLNTVVCSNPFSYSGGEKKLFVGNKLTTSIVVPDSITCIGDNVFRGWDFLTDVKISKNVESIGDAAFLDCTGLTNITIPKRVNSIGESAFYGCTGFTSITIPEGVNSIGDSAFRNCTGLTSLTILRNVKEIGREAFYGCTSLTNVSILDGVKVIGYSAFGECYGITELHIESIESWLNIDIDSEIFSKFCKEEKKLFIGNEQITSIVIPDSISNIGDYAFRGWNFLTTVNMPEKLMSIGENAFSGCDNLTSITIPKSVRNIGYCAFAECQNLSSIIFKGNAPEIAESCFYLDKLKAYYIDDGTWFESNMLHYGANQIEWIPYDGIEFENPIIVVPGIMGSNLYDSDDRRIWSPETSDPKTWAEFSSSFKLDIDTRPVLHTRNNLIDQHSIEESEREYGADDSYKNLVNRLCAEFPNRRIYFFSYDWRQSNALSADALADLIDKITEIGTGQVDIVAHSMGGLVVSYYIKNHDGEKKVNKIITCATPYEGAPALLHRAMTNHTLNSYGPDLLIWLGAMNIDSKQKFPSLAELAPTDSYHQTHPSKVMKEIWSKPKKRVVQFTEFGSSTFFYDDYECEPSDMSLKDYQNTCFDIFNDNYTNARTFHASLKTNSNGNYNLLKDRSDTYFIVGVNQKTIESVGFRDGGIEKLFYEKKGDGTVPYDSATMNGALNSSIGADEFGNNRFLTVNTDHGGVVKVKKALDYIVKVLGDTKTDVFSDIVSDQNRNSLYVKVDGSVNIRIEKNGEVLSSNESDYNTLTSFGMLDFSGGDGEVKHIYLENGIYNISLYGAEEGTMDMSVELRDYDNNTIVDKLFPEVPITENTLMSIESNLYTETKLDIDNDGDGKIDEQWSVEIPDPDSISFSSTSEEIPTNETLRLELNVLPEGSNDHVTWASSNEKVATVDRNGIVTAKTYGKTVIVAESRTMRSLRTYCTIQTRFYDVNDSTQSYYKPVYWGADNGVVAGYDGGVYFGPDNVCTRAQFVTFLWRLAGKPNGKKNVSFNDISTSANYYRAVKWAVSEGIIVGYKDDNTFRPDNEVTRGQVATMLWRFAGKKTPALPKTSPFSDINASNSSYRAVVWGQKAGVIKGYKDGTFQPDGSCLRQHIVTFLYRYARDVMKKPV